MKCQHFLKTPEPTIELPKEPTKQKESKLKLQQEFMHENQRLIDLRNPITKNKITENEIVNILEKILDFSKQQKDKGRPGMLTLRPSDLARVAKVFDPKGIKILNPKQMLQRIPITLAHVKAGITFENLLDKIYQFIQTFYREKEVT